ncbi:MAG TPA: amidase [Acidimicrobiales bacterium]|nr:amidase [Acidimicrobiales bacterium]
MQLADLDATAQAELVGSGQCSPRELLDATIEAIERVNPALNAVVIPLFDYAHAQLERGEFGDGPFRGVPLVLKDLGAALAGTPQYSGTKVLRDHKWISPSDSELTARFRRAGFIFTGKTNTPEFGLSPTTEPETFGPTRNPWHTDRIVGGSSGGSASAVASRMVAIAHAGDGGGSIRNPAGACGVVGLKPSRGRITLGPDIGESWSGCVTEFVIARTVRDLAHVLDCVHGYASGDPAPAAPPARPYGDELGREPGRLRVGMFWGNAATPGSPDARAAVEGCARLLASLGHHVHDGYPAELDHNELGNLLGVSVAASVAHELDIIAARTGEPVPPDGVEPATWLFAERGRALTATQYLANIDDMHRYARRLASWWEDNDILITPTMSEAAPPIGELKGADVERIVRLVPYTAPYNITGQPGIALPLHWTSDGLPLGIQLISRYGGEDVLIRLASQIEAAAPWIGRRPAVCA